MNYKELFKIALLLISSPAKAWEEIRLEEDRRKVIAAFVYPMIALCALAVFGGSLFTNGWSGAESFQIAMRNCCVVAVALFGGYFLASYLINALGMKMFNSSSHMPLAQQFAGYSLVVTFLVNIITGLLPEFGLIALVLQFYIVYIVWVGADELMGIPEDQRLKYTLIASLFLMACPLGIHMIFSKLLVILN